MLKPRRNGLVIRTTLWILGTVACIGLISLWRGNAMAVERETLRTQNQLRELLDTVSRSAGIACFLQDRQLAGEISQGLLSNRIVERVIIRAGTTVLAASVQPDKTTEAQSVAMQEGPTFIYRPLQSPFNPDETIGEILLAPHTTELENRVRETSYFIVILLLAQLAAMGTAVALAVYGLITRALKQVADRLHDLPAEQGAKLPYPAGHENDEIGGLVNYINRMMDRLVGLLNEERRLRLQREIEERKFRSIFENAGTGIFLIDQGGKMLSYNPACREIMQAAGRTEAEPISRVATLLNDDEIQARNMIAACLQEGKNIQRDINLAGKNGNADRWIHVTLSQIEEVVFQGVANDITERKSAENAARKVAVTDALTGIFNRLGFETQLQRRLSKGYKESEFWLALMLIDLDLFKQVNDTYGHDAGDQVLIRFARLLENTVRKSDLIGRLGGDEFVVFLDYVDQPPTLEKIAQNIIAGVAEPMDIGQGRTAKIGASIGIALGKAQNVGRELLFKQADEAMYQAKKSGRNTYCFYADVR